MSHDDDDISPRVLYKQPVMEHEDLRAMTAKARIAWGETSPGTEKTVRERKKVRDLAREFSGLAIATLVHACQAGDSTSSRVAAAKELLARGFGQPKDDGPQQQQLIGVAISIDATREAARALLSDPMARAALRKTLREKPVDEPQE